MCDQLRYGKDISFVNPMDPEALKINKTGIALFIAMPARFSKTGLSLNHRLAANRKPSPWGEGGQFVKSSATTFRNKFQRREIA